MPMVNEAQVKDILRVLCRMPVAAGQLGLYRLALDAPPEGFQSQQIREWLGLSKAQVRGLLAALSLRINNTPGETYSDSKPGIGLMIDQDWDGRKNTYRPRAELLEAIRRLPEMAEVMRRPRSEGPAMAAVTCALPEGVQLLPPVVATVPTDPGPLPVVYQPTRYFDALLDQFERDLMAYPAELIANLLLALQVKRFVILTGISGTGKTSMAKVLAKHLPVRHLIETPADSGDLGSILTVRPYMMKYARMTLPRHLAARVDDLLPEPDARKVMVKWPDGQGELTVYVTANYTTLLFSGLFRDWFRATFREGDSFAIRLHGPEDAPDSLVFAQVPLAIPREVEVPNVEIVAVRPDWTDHRGLLGAYNQLTSQYLTTPFLALLLRAAEETRRALAEQPPRIPAPFFLVLDEMNLARVEHYFADFLSALESGEPLHLHDSVELEEGSGDPDAADLPIPRRLPVPPNLFVIGTVNVDESTYLFSPKVLDRAFTLELNAVDLQGLGNGIVRGGDLELGKWNGRLDPPEKPGSADWKWLLQQEEGDLAAQVEAFHRLLAGHNRHFGYRVATEIARFVRLAIQQGSEPSEAAWAALDLALLEKVLVKLHGTRSELGQVLKALLKFALIGAEEGAETCNLEDWRYLAAEAVVRRSDPASEREAVFPRSAAKLWRMSERLAETGFTSWIE